MFDFKRSFISATVLLIVLGACGGVADKQQEISVVAPLDTSVTVVDGVSFELLVDTVAKNLDVPWGLEFLSEDRLLVGERSGRILVIEGGRLREEPWAELDVYANEQGIGPETGLLGIRKSPDFDRDRHVYVVATFWRTEGDRNRSVFTRAIRKVQGYFSPSTALRYTNRVIRYTDSSGVGVDPVVIVDNLLTAYYHAGGGIGFGPEGALYLSIGDAMQPGEVDRFDSHMGKILRYTILGEIPADNPLSGSPVWASGLRNTQAFDWLSDGTMIGVEHGPSGMVQESGRAGNDELNILKKGRSYGWPHAVGWQSVAGSISPLWVWREAIAPAGMSVYRGSLSPWQGSLLVGGLRGGLKRVVLQSEQGEPRVVAWEQLIEPSEFGRIRTVVSDEKGYIWLTTSNRDARGQAREGDDLLLRIEPVLSGENE